jgi:glutamate---cysteine ligase / carboxylate-amine ligase
MPKREPPFSIGVEEEYLLVDRRSRDLVPDPPAEYMKALSGELGERVSHELLRCQVEVATRPCNTIAEARADLAHLRHCVAEVAERFDMAPVAVSTHPFADWTPQTHTDLARYAKLYTDIGQPAQRMMIGGQHVHVGLGDDDDLRIDLMNQARYFLPHLLALSTSSPFWRGRLTGLKSYRVAAFDEMPRTGLPDRFADWGDYQRHVALLVEVGVIEDASKLWWDLRPSCRFPTLELRICDVCTRIEDALAITAAFACLLRYLWRLRRRNCRWRDHAAMLIKENRWRAQRFGTDESMIDFGRREMVRFAELVEEFIEMLAEDAEVLGCADQLRHLRTILERGTSAHRQVAIYEAARREGADHEAALHRVVDWLVETTRHGL